MKLARYLRMIYGVATLFQFHRLLANRDRLVVALRHAQAAAKIVQSVWVQFRLTTLAVQFVDRLAAETRCLAVISKFS